MPRKKLSAVPDAPAKPKVIEKFYRIKEHDLAKGAAFRGYQGEVIEVVDGKITKRTYLDKPNLFEYAQTFVVDMMDPRNL